MYKQHRRQTDHHRRSFRCPVGDPERGGLADLPDDLRLRAVERPAGAGAAGL